MFIYWIDAAKEEDKNSNAIATVWQMCTICPFSCLFVSFLSVSNSRISNAVHDRQISSFFLWSIAVRNNLSCSPQSRAESSHVPCTICEFQIDFYACASNNEWITVGRLCRMRAIRALCTSIYLTYLSVYLRSSIHAPTSIVYKTCSAREPDSFSIKRALTQETACVHCTTYAGALVPVYFVSCTTTTALPKLSRQMHALCVCACVCRAFTVTTRSIQVENETTLNSILISVSLGCNYYLLMILHLCRSHARARATQLLLLLNAHLCAQFRVPLWQSKWCWYNH